ncbi:MAG: transporter substrate-binding domain-containing protein [Bacteroidales bacterium]
MKKATLLLFVFAKLIFTPLIADSLQNVFPSEKKKLLINFDKEFPPFEFINDDGEPDGLNVELFREIMKRLNQPYEFSMANWGEIVNDFEAGKTDLILGIANTPERKSHMNFAIPHSEIFLEIISPKERPVRIIDELRNKNILVQEQDWAQEYIKNNDLSQHIRQVKTVEEGLFLLATEGYDAFFCTNIVTRFHKKRAKLAQFHFQRADISTRPYSIAVPKENERLLYMINGTLYELKMEGKLDELYDKWLGVYDKQGIPDIVKNLLIGCFCVALMLIIFVITLRQRINKATGKLYSSQQQLKDTNLQLYLVLRAGNITPFTWNVTTNKITVSYRSRNKDQKHELFEEIVDLDILINYFLPKYITPLHDYFNQIREGKKETCHFEISSDKTGKYTYYDLYISRDTTQKTEIVIGYIQDITERKINELDLAEAKERAERSDRFKSAFIANMSHEIRTPLNSIVGFSQLMRNAETEEEKDMYMNVIQENNNHLLKLITDVLDLSKIEAGYIELIDKAFYVNEFMDELYQRFNPCVCHEVVLVMIKPDFDCFIEFDKDRLLQIMSTLLSNAQKFTTHGSITFGYKVHPEGILFYVSDTGIGIASEYQHKIFERFEKVNSFAPGAGIGLSICKLIIESAGGNISVTSQLNKGSRFEVFLPCIPEVVCLTEKETLKDIS